MMNNNYHFFRYVAITSKMHLMNSRMKIIWFLLCLLCLVFFKDYLSLLLLFTFLIITAGFSKVKLSNYLTGLFVVWPLYLIIFFTVFLISLNVLTSLFFVIKFVLIILLFLIMTSTTSLSEIAWGLEMTFNPLKKLRIPISKISLRIAMDIKFISLIYDESRDIKKSMAYRGAVYKSGSFKSFKKIIIPVVCLAYKSSRRMIKIMKLRFYGSNKRRTNYHDNKITWFDKVLVITSVILVYVVILLGWC